LPFNIFLLSIRLDSIAHGRSIPAGPTIGLHHDSLRGCLLVGRVVVVHRRGLKRGMSGIITHEGHGHGVGVSHHRRGHGSHVKRQRTTRHGSHLGVRHLSTHARVEGTIQKA